ncbi:MAG: DUF4126 domain-containing protein [Chloroflexi bacterium HGW-Chloroflexi-6]|nr:MAG: DUF4126 domain-containing protein [Chloroflexi bacterium HGW-Chloroflexi-6]
MELLTGIFSAFGLSASAGLNAYIPLMVIAVIARYTDWFKLQAPFDTLTNPWIMILIGVLIIIEFLADSFPAVNHINDAIQTFIRPVAGAIVFAASAQVLTDISPVFSLACGLLVAGGVHTVKAAAVRPAVTATTGGAANPLVSLTEDVVATVTSVLAMLIPVLMAGLVIIMTSLLIWWLVRRMNRTTTAS